MPQRQERSGSKSKRSSYDGYLHEGDGKVVLGVMLALSLPLSILSLVYPTLVFIPVGLMIGATGGYFVTPDADHMGTTHEEYRAMRKLGFFGSLLVAWMVPYAYLFRHRSKKSHSIFPGTPIRFLWFTLPFLAIAILTAIHVRPVYAMWYPIMLVGWSIQDMVHYNRDGLGLLGLKDRRIPGRA